ncbi:MAG: hypothetical protein R3257_01760 [bacterium]|nr:hypothetical protein [bacterium]
MSKYVRKHRFKILGLAAPLFFVLILTIAGIGILPSQETFGLPGEPCTTSPDLDCDPCNGESCQFNSSNSQFECANFPGTATFPNFDPNISDPFCPNNTFFNSGSIFACDLQYPDCWRTCVTSTVASSFNTAICMPDDSYCDGLSGGTAANACRVGVCQTDMTVDFSNVSGCDYAFVGGTQCVNCAPPQPPTLPSCGNGVCEPGASPGENCGTCPEDCLVPGFDQDCAGNFPNPPQQANDFCNAVSNPNIEFITFPGPPFNICGLDCEDGDVCTDNMCSGSTCGSTDKVCDPSVSDLCCPSGCNAAPAGTTCSPNDLNCDVDCLPEEVCPIPTPTPTPTPPPADICVTGSGHFWDTIRAGCADCSLTKGPVAANPKVWGSLALLLGLGLGMRLLMRKKAQ